MPIGYLFALLIVLGLILYAVQTYFDGTQSLKDFICGVAIVVFGLIILGWFGLLGRLHV